MKKWFAVMLAALLVCAASLCSAEDITLPLVERLGPAVKADTITSQEEGRVVVVYEPADESSLDEFLMMAPMCGVYPMAMELDPSSTLEAYFLIGPGTALDGYIIYAPEEQQLCIDFALPAGDIYILNERSAEALRYMYDYDMKLPADATGNVAPQFYAVMNRQPFYDGVMGDAAFAFDGASCWTEWYDEVELGKMGDYATIMGLFGFSAEVDLYDMDEYGVISTVLLRFDNGDAQVLVLYNATEKTATVYYEPGVTYYLLDGGDLNDILPQ